MQTQHLGFIGLEDDTISACLSMLKIMDGRSTVSWSQSAPEEADVLMVSSQQCGSQQSWEKGDKPCIVVYPCSQAKPAFPFTLSHPFRIAQLIEVLDAVGKH
ncbi:MAG: hypothetical protein R3292_13250 [Alcanivorax sp.]|nr:hypothetical protein [Alcanivorax sp.]